MNLGSSPAYLPETVLVDTNGNESNPSLKGIELGSIWFGKYKEVNPRMSNDGFVLFEVPDVTEQTLRLDSTGHLGNSTFCSLGKVKRYPDLQSLLIAFSANKSQFIGQ